MSGRSRCGTCGGPSVVKGPGGQRACLAHVADVPEPRWVKVPDASTGSGGIVETAQALHEAGALTPELARTLRDVWEATTPAALAEVHAQMEELIAEAPQPDDLIAEASSELGEATGGR